MCSNFSLPEPEPLRHNVSNYLQAAKATKAAKGMDVETDEDKDGVDENGDIFITRESEVGPEVTHIYQIENKVLYLVSEYSTGCRTVWY